MRAIASGGPALPNACTHRRDTQAGPPAAPPPSGRRHGHDIQFTPASLFHFVVIFFACVQNSIEPLPVMSPTPNFESFHPPNENGSRGTGTPTLTPTMPALARSVTYRASPPFSVNTAAALPYGDAFSMASAWSTSRVRMIASTGPNTSS